jgi:hypothetical protein
LLAQCKEAVKVLVLFPRIVVSINHCCYNASLHDLSLLMPIIITIIFSGSGQCVGRRWPFSSK